MLLPLLQVVDGVLDGQISHPLVLADPLVLDLVGHVDGVAAVLVHRVGEGDGVLNRLQREDHVLLRQLHLRGDLRDAGVLVVARGECVAGLERLVGGVAQGARDADGVVVPQVAPDLADDHRHAVGAQAHVHAQIEVVQALHQADAAHLKQVVHVLAPIVKALQHAQHQAKVPLDQLVTRLHVPGVGALHQFAHGLVGEHRERGRVHAADFHLVQGHLVHLQHEQYCPREVEVYQNESTRRGILFPAGPVMSAFIPRRWCNSAESRRRTWCGSPPRRRHPWQERDPCGRGSCPASAACGTRSAGRTRR